MASEGARTSWQSAANKDFLTLEELQNDVPCSDFLSSTNTAESKKAKVEDDESFLCLPTNGLESVDMTDLPWQFAPSSYMIYGSDCVPLEKASVSGSRKVQTDSNMQMKKVSYGESVDMELDWYWLISQRQSESKCCAMHVVRTEDPCKEIADEAFEEAVQDTLERFQEAERGDKVNEEHFTKSELSRTKLSGNLSLSGAGISHGRSGNLSAVINSRQHPVSGMADGEKLEHKDSVSWRTDDRKKLAALVSKRTPKCIENCDLPVSQNSFTYKGSLASCDLSPGKAMKMGSKSLDRILLTSLLQGNEPTFLENRSLPSSPLILGTSDPTPLQKHQQNISQPLAIPTVQAPSMTTRKSKYSSDEKCSSWNGSGGTASGGIRGADMLGEALCHSQTRAREAEKAAAQAMQEKEHLQHLLFREASLSLTYRQWVRLLELENMWLKMHIRDHSVFWMEHAYINPSVAFERLSNNRWKHFGKRFTHKQMQQVSSLLQGKEQYCKWACERSNMVVGYTIGLAFALGLSLAGAGFMIGWSLGWMLLTY